MKSLLRLRARVVRILRYPVAAFATSKAGRALFRAWLAVVGSRAAYELHDEMLGWLVLRPLRDRRSLLSRRLRGAARRLAYRPGIVAGGPQARLTLIVIWGAPADAAARTVEQVCAPGSDPGFTPLFLTDCDDFRAFREHRVPFEHIPSRAEWSRHHGDAGWTAYVDRRVRGVLENWSPDRVVIVPASDGDALERDGLVQALAGQPD